MSTLLGYGMIAAGFGGLAWTIVQTSRQSRRLSSGTGSSASLQAPVFATDTLSRHGDRKEALEVIKPTQVVSLLGEGRERAVATTVTLAAMTQTNGSWVETGNAYRALELAGNVWIFKIPSREGGDPIWIKTQRVDAPSSLQVFFKGDETKKGPARLFKENGQTDPVPFMLPKAFRNTNEYEVSDIGRFNTTVDGETEVFTTDDAYPFVTARNRGGGLWLFYLDSRKDMAKGFGGLFTGEEFEPEVDISSLL
jgi:hypothetical protein